MENNKEQDGGKQSTTEVPLRRNTTFGNFSEYNPLPQNAPGAAAAVGHTLENSIPLSIFPIAADKLCICFCGLPGRGKTHIARRLARYLEFFHALPVRVFSVADYRRKEFGGMKDADWFDPTNAEACDIRQRCNELAIRDMIDFLNQHQNVVVIMDSTNHTHERRANILQTMHAHGTKTLFIEVQNENEKYLTALYRDVSVTSPDYEGINNEHAEQDLRRRVANYRKIFESIDAQESHAVESKWSYFKCDHSRQHFVIHNVRGYYQLKIVHFIVSLRITSHSFYLTRHGQSEYNAVGRIGGDSGLSQHGVNYARTLGQFVDAKITKDESGNKVPCRLWTSTMRRTKETAQFIVQEKITIRDEDDPTLEYEWLQMRPRAWHHLDELFAGDCDGMTYEEIEQIFPEEFERRKVDKLAYRYPRGESYLDVIARLEPMIIEMERHREPLLIIGHQGILRIIYAFYMGLSRADAPYVSIPLNCVVELSPMACSCKEKRYVLYSPVKALPADGQDEPTNKYANLVDPQSH